jgi:hypothetical protein
MYGESVHNLFPRIRLKEIWKSIMNLSKDFFPSDRDSKLEPSQYEAGLLITRPMTLVGLSKIFDL